MTNKKTRIIVAEFGTKLFGLLVDRVVQVITIKDSQMELELEGVVDLHENYVHAVAKEGDRIIIILDLEKVIMGARRQDAEDQL